MTSYGEDRLGTPGLPTYGEDRLEIPASSNSNGFKQRSGILGGGIPMLEEKYLSMNSPERTNDIQDGCHYEKLARH